MAFIDVDGVICANPECKVAETGRCVEGFEIDKCPHYGREAEESVHEDSASDASDADTGIALPLGATHDSEAASGLMRRGASRVIAVIGPREAGKTSLIAGVYDLFQTGPVSGIQFRRSETLHAFEQTCHDARAASRRGEPHMHRTPFQQVRFYHLEVSNSGPAENISMLFADRAGEEYRSATDDVALVAEFHEISRADTLTVLVDGQRLLDAGARHNVRNDTIMMLQALRDGDALRSASQFALVLTKLDLVMESEYRARAMQDFNALLADARRMFGVVFSVVEGFQVAASPKGAAVQRGAGVPELIQYWLRETIQPLERLRPIPVLERPFARLTQAEEREDG